MKTESGSELRTLPSHRDSGQEVAHQHRNKQHVVVLLVVPASLPSAQPPPFTPPPTHCILTEREIKRRIVCSHPLVIYYALPRRLTLLPLSLPPLSAPLVLLLGQSLLVGTMAAGGVGWNVLSFQGREKKNKHDTDMIQRQMCKFSLFSAFSKISACTSASTLCVQKRQAPKKTPR